MAKKKTQPTTQTVAVAEQFATVKNMLMEFRGELAAALPRHITADRMVSVALNSIRRNPKLLECTRQSMFAAIRTSAELGLEPDGVTGQAYLIPRKNNRKGGIKEVRFQPGYQGLMDLARRSGKIAAIIPRVVYEKDEFAYGYRLEGDYLNHQPFAGDDAGEIAYVYCIVRLKDGTQQFEVWSRERVDAHRKRYSPASEDSAWVTAWEAMAKKTMIIQVLKYCPKSVELARAIALDEASEIGLDQQLAVTVEPVWTEVPEEPKPSKLDELVSKEAVKKTAPAKASKDVEKVKKDPEPPPAEEPKPAKNSPAYATDQQIKDIGELAVKALDEEAQEDLRREMEEDGLSFDRAEIIIVDLLKKLHRQAHAKQE